MYLFGYLALLSENTVLYKKARFEVLLIYQNCKMYSALTLQRSDCYPFENRLTYDWIVSPVSGTACLVTQLSGVAHRFSNSVPCRTAGGSIRNNVPCHTADRCINNSWPYHTAAQMIKNGLPCHTAARSIKTGVLCHTAARSIKNSWPYRTAARSIKNSCPECRIK